MSLETILPNLRCPVNGDGLTRRGDMLISTAGREYPIVHGVPVLLSDTDDPTLWVVKASYEAARKNPDDPYQAETVAVLPHELPALKERLHRADQEKVDPVISFLMIATNGYLYGDLVGTLKEVPIPDIRLLQGSGLLLDIGCSWGRWSVAAARKGYSVVGIDPSLGGVLAAKRLTQKLGLDVTFVVGTALRLPFAHGTFDHIYSNSVVQHFSYENAEAAIREAAKVAKKDATLLMQMPNKYGVRCLYHQARRGFSSGTGFDVRYYSPSDLRDLFSSSFGPSRLSIDGFFGLGIQASDRRFLPFSKRLVVDASESLRQMSGALPFLLNVADSLYVTSRRAA
jgi:ubiquinone/menaquinone biosynthesis C-methylase UbiE